MEVDVSEIVLGGFQAVVLVVFLVQTVIEVFPALRGRWTPVIALVAGLGVALVAKFAPAEVQEALGSGLALAAAASLTVRYVKRGGNGEERLSTVTSPPAIIEFPAAPENAKRS